LTIGFDPLTFAQQLDDGSPNTPAPVEQWNPPFCGDIDLVIKQDGCWYYGGTPIGRPNLVRLFARVLKREGDRYFLVTPVEKVGICVEDVPFIVITADVVAANDGEQVVWLETGLGDRFPVDAAHPIRMGGTENLPVPYVMVRGGMEGRLSRPVYYELAEAAEVHDTAKGERYYISSSGKRFLLGGA
jgi:hypothetical protein